LVHVLVCVAHASDVPCDPLDAEKGDSFRLDDGGLLRGHDGSFWSSPSSHEEVWRAADVKFFSEGLCGIDRV